MTDIVDKNDAQAVETNNTQGQQNQVTADDTPPDDNDPMIASMKEAEAEIAKGDEGKSAEGTEGKTETEGEQTGQPAADQPKTGDGNKPIMIPKPRLDEVLGERDQFKDQVAYLQGVVNTQKEMLKGAAPSQTNENGTGTTPAAPDHSALIAKAEDDKLALAKKYEDGDISLVDFKKGEIELDRSIRNLEDQRISAKIEETNRNAAAAVNAGRKQDRVEEAALTIQEKHPYIAEIDKLPDVEKIMRWNQLEAEAVLNLNKQGVVIDLKNLTVESHTALMMEKARLTDTYGPMWTGKTISRNNADGQQRNQTSERAQQRAAKIDLSLQQPPDSSGLGVGENVQKELTEADLNGMNQEQIADALSRNSHAVNRAAGFKQR